MRFSISPITAIRLLDVGTGESTLVHSRNVANNDTGFPRIYRAFSVAMRRLDLIKATQLRKCIDEVAEFSDTAVANYNYVRGSSSFSFKGKRYRVSLHAFDGRDLPDLKPTKQSRITFQLNRVKRKVNALAQEYNGLAYHFFQQAAFLSGYEEVVAWKVARCIRMLLLAQRNAKRAVLSSAAAAVPQLTAACTCARIKQRGSDIATPLDTTILTSLKGHKMSNIILSLTAHPGNTVTVSGSEVLEYLSLVFSPRNPANRPLSTRDTLRLAPQYMLFLALKKAGYLHAATKITSKATANHVAAVAQKLVENFDYITCQSKIITDCNTEISLSFTTVISEQPLITTSFDWSKCTKRSDIAAQVKKSLAAKDCFFLFCCLLSDLYADDEFADCNDEELLVDRAVFDLWNNYQQMSTSESDGSVLTKQATEAGLAQLVVQVGGDTSSNHIIKVEPPVGNEALVACRYHQNLAQVLMQEFVKADQTIVHKSVDSRFDSLDFIEAFGMVNDLIEAARENFQVHELTSKFEFFGTPVQFWVGNAATMNCIPEGYGLDEITQMVEGFDVSAVDWLCEMVSANEVSLPSYLHGRNLEYKQRLDDLIDVSTKAAAEEPDHNQDDDGPMPNLDNHGHLDDADSAVHVAESKVPNQSIGWEDHQPFVLQSKKGNKRLAKLDFSYTGKNVKLFYCLTDIDKFDKVPFSHFKLLEDRHMLVLLGRHPARGELDDYVPAGTKFYEVSRVPATVVFGKTALNEGVRVMFRVYLVKYPDGFITSVIQVGDTLDKTLPSGARVKSIRGRRVLDVAYAWSKDHMDFKRLNYRHYTLPNHSVKRTLTKPAHYLVNTRENVLYAAFLMGLGSPYLSRKAVTNAVDKINSL